MFMPADGLLNMKPFPKELDNLILNDKRDTKKRAEERLLSIYKQYLENMADVTKLKQSTILEPNFLAQELALVASAQKAGYSITVEKAQAEFDSSGLKEGIEWLEISHIRGLSVERGYNPFFEMAICNQTHSWRGLVSFTYNSSVARDRNYKAPYPTFTNKLILRAYIKIATPYRLSIKAPEATEPTKTPFQRFLVVENDLYKPPLGAVLENYGETILPLYTLNRWYIVDVDGVMKGNPLLPKFDQLNQTFVY